MANADTVIEAVTTATCTDILREYADALRGSWGEIDGRGEKEALYALAAAIEQVGPHEELDSVHTMALRNVMGLCLDGRAHWSHECDNDPSSQRYCPSADFDAEFPEEFWDAVHAFEERRCITVSDAHEAE